MLTVADLRRPRGWEVLAGADTGTYMGGLITLLSPTYELYCVEEFPNYHYVGDGTIELLGITVGEWFRAFGTRLQWWTKEARNFAWVDANTTFKTEVANGLRFKMNKKHLELRTEITREYMRHGRIHLMPWLKVLPHELQEATWPEHESGGSGRLVRIKDRDHVLDCLEHVCSRRPHPDFGKLAVEKPRGLDEFVRKFARDPIGGPRTDPHLGAQ